MFQLLVARQFLPQRRRYFNNSGPVNGHDEASGWEDFHQETTSTDKTSTSTAWGEQIQAFVLRKQIYRYDCYQQQVLKCSRLTQV